MEPNTDTPLQNSLLNHHCLFCPYKTSRKSDLEAHIRTHTGEKPFKCPHPQCQKSFSQTANLKSHELVHTKDKKFQCSECNKKFALKWTLNLHKRIHLEEKPFACPQCPFTTKYKTALQTHMTRIHLDERLFKCEECHYTAKTKTELNCHLRVHLDGEEKENIKKNKCPHCPYKTIRSSDMKNHLRTHTREKPFPCPHCPHKSTELGSLKVHIAYRHTGEKKFKCEFCDYSTATSCNLNRHMRTHTGEKPYKFLWEGCKFQTGYCGRLKKHQVTHTNKKFKFLKRHFPGSHTNPQKHKMAHESRKLIECRRLSRSSSRVSKVHVTNAERDFCKKYFSLKGMSSFKEIKLRDVRVEIQKFLVCSEKECKFFTHQDKEKAVHLNRHSTIQLRRLPTAKYAANYERL